MTRLRRTDHVSEWRKTPAGAWWPAQWRSYTRTTVRDGSNVWSVDSVQGEKSNWFVSLMQSTWLRQVDHVGNMSRLVPLVREPRRLRVEFLRTEKVSGADPVTVAVKADGQPDVLLSFDRESWLCVKCEFSVRPAFFLGPARVQYIFSGYKMVEVRMFAMRRVMLFGEGRDESEAIECRPLKGVDPKQFAKP